MPDHSEGCLDPSQTAFFFDFDGTLAHIVGDPLAVAIEPNVLRAVETLFAASGGALAIISGRSVEQLGALLKPHTFPVSGVHGQQMRGIDGAVEDLPYNKDEHRELVVQSNEFATGRDGVIVEAKPGSVAIHYRLAPAEQAACEAFVERLHLEHPRVHLLRGKMVIEIKMGARTKGDALRDFMEREPFKGRHPVFFGDDVTDEHGFNAVSELGGHGFKVGAGQTGAEFRFGDIDAFHDWLLAFADSIIAKTAPPTLPPPSSARHREHTMQESGAVVS